MTQEEKQLLLIDLCSREPYHPRIQVFNDGYEGFQVGEFDTNLWLHHIDAFRFDRVEIKPYLRPMSSMTEEESKEFALFQTDFYIDGFLYPIAAINMVNWLNAHHFDFRGLIEKGLALEAPENMYDIK